MSTSWTTTSATTRTDYQVLRLTVRQLYSWQAHPATTTTPEPDLATGMPVVTDHGLKTDRDHPQRGDVEHEPGPPVTAADVVRGIKRACNPSPVSFGGMADFENTIMGLTALLQGLPGRGGQQRLGDEEVHRGPQRVRHHDLGQHASPSADPARGLA